MLKIIVLIFSISIVTHAKPTLKSNNYKTRKITSFDDVVWGFSFISQNEALVTLRDGDFYYLNLKSNEKKKLISPPIETGGQGGLLDVYTQKIKGLNYVYLTFSEKHKGQYTTSLAKGVYKKESIQNLKVIFRAKVYGKTTLHFGSRVIIKGDYLFMTIGDRGNRKYAQNLSYHNGKILRLTLDGKPAPGNPFTQNKKALPEIWSLGHRNPQGIDIDHTTNEVYSVEFGPRGGDELNLIKKSLNYGWPITTYGKEYYGPSIGVKSKKGMEKPLAHWTPSISPSGMAFYKYDKLSNWQNNLFIAALGSQHLRRLRISNGKVIEQEVLFKSLNERVRQVRSAPDGWLYFSTDSGKIIQVYK